MTEAARALRVLVCDGPRVEAICNTVTELGHDVIPRQSTLNEVPRITELERPEVALVIVSDATQDALDAIDRIVRQSVCPVIAVLDVEDRDFINEAAKHGIFAYISNGEDPSEMQSSIDIVLRRFAEYHDLEGAFARRAMTERAKGILMERHGIDEHAAFEMLRYRARQSGRKLFDVAEAIELGHAMLPEQEKAFAQNATQADDQ